MSLNYGYVDRLFIKPDTGKEMFERKQLLLKQGCGIDGDVNADPVSPRQILIVRNEDLTTFSIQPGQLRENIVLRGFDSTVFSPGALLRSPGGAAIRLTFYCEPCKQIAPLVTSLKQIQRQRGILGVVIAGGGLTVGDRVELQPHAFPALSEIPYERFLALLEKIPVGRVVTYRLAIAAIGVTPSYLRVMPIYLKKAAALGYPVHRVVDSGGNLIQHVADQREKLRAEGVEAGDGVQAGELLHEYLWCPVDLY